MIHAQTSVQPIPQEAQMRKLLRVAAWIWIACATTIVAFDAQAEDFPGGRLRVVHVAPNDVLNLRRFPTSNAPIVGFASPDAQNLEYLGKSQGVWLLVRSTNAIGWVNRAFVAAQPEIDVSNTDSQKIGYGSRAGMTVTVESRVGIDSSNAIIHTRHTKDDAVSFCRDYVLKVTEACIAQELKTNINNSIAANCNTGDFTDFAGERHRFEGLMPSDSDSDLAKYKVRDDATGTLEDGSSASGYSTNMGIFRALCPAHAPADE